MPNDNDEANQVIMSRSGVFRSVGPKDEDVVIGDPRLMFTTDVVDAKNRCEGSVGSPFPPIII
jgi:hypothetical protein